MKDSHDDARAQNAESNVSESRQHELHSTVRRRRKSLPPEQKSNFGGSSENISTLIKHDNMKCRNIPSMLASLSSNHHLLRSDSSSPSAAGLLLMPSLAFDKMELMARSAWESCATTELLSMPLRARDKAEEIAKHAEELARYAWEESTTELMAMPGRARGRAEEIARHATAELRTMPSRARDKAEEIAHQAEGMARQAWLAGKTLMHHHHLPQWMRDNDFLLKGHRPQLNSFCACFKSIFSIHTETGNIWTHLIGCVAFIVVATYFLTRPSIEIQWQEKAVFSAFFAGAILCLGFSCLFHTVYCHSEKVGRLFSKLDYCGIALLIMGSFVPWLYYSFYCRISPQITYLALVITLGIICIIISLWDRFGEPQFRPLRAGLFVALGLTGIVPCAHYVITDGFYHAVNFAALGWLGIVGLLYVSGAGIYAARFPECMWPGKFDIWFQSHQIFHVFVVLAAFIHYYGMSQIAYNRLNFGCRQEVVIANEYE